MQKPLFFFSINLYEYKKYFIQQYSIFYLIVVSHQRKQYTFGGDYEYFNYNMFVNSVCTHIITRFI